MRARMVTELGTVTFHLEPEKRRVYGSIADYDYDRQLTTKLREAGFDIEPYGVFRLEGDGESIAQKLNEIITEIKVISAEEKVERLCWQEPILCILSRHNVEIQQDEDEDEEEA